MLDMEKIKIELLYQMSNIGQIVLEEKFPGTENLEG
jgi:hypothetical protein